MADLYMVGPLGDEWYDIPIRAQRILSESALIVTQDVESVREWLEQGNIRTPAIDIDRDDAVSSILAALRVGDVAWLIAGLADISDSARHLLARLSEQGIEPLSVPGPWSVISRLVVSGLPTDSLTYLGVLSGDCRERRAMLESVFDEHQTLVFKIAAEHLTEALCDVIACLGDRRLALHGEQGTWRGRASQGGVHLGGDWLTLVIDGAAQDVTWTDEQVSACIRELLDAGRSSRDVAREIARRSGWPRRQVYQLAVSVRTED